MYLKNLHISNFRCFPEYTIDFAPGVTVLFGKNGSGKTTLINAIHKALSFIMYSEKIKEKDPKTKRAKVVNVLSIRRNNPFVKVEGYSKMGDVSMEGAKPGDLTIEIGATAEFDGNPISWAMSAYAINCRIRPSEYKHAFSRFYKWHEATGKYPLLAYYSDGYPHLGSSGKLTKREKTKATFIAKNNSPEIAYTDWNSDEGCTKMWIARLETKMRNAELLHRRINLFETSKEGNLAISAPYISEELYKNSIQELPAVEKEINAIIGVLKNFSVEDSNIRIDTIELSPYDSLLSIIANKGKRYAFRKLPAGYKRLFYIVLDIAYRSYLLNKTTDTEGIVVIDEIDLHLHPELEKVVLGRLIKVFPKIQFIVSTHSPLVLTGIETENRPNTILHMFPDASKPEKTHDIYGIDYNSGIEDVMGVESKNVELDYMINLCAYMRKRGKMAQADKLIDRILTEFAKNRDEIEKMVTFKMSEL
ncbi:AAA family ATPase [Prevotella sp.]|uniref:AAA family ATPase n=1 Tax=Prevotella sp. TaxID=59823 RepID=UPI0026492DC2|nr:AAA family ATPase [Prevotella sp.]MDN5552589.1 AAA family ATPase [Prevotella sp.]